MKRQDSSKLDANRRQVLSMRAHGMSLALIAKRVDCSVEQLEVHYARELERAYPEMRAKVGGDLFAAAKSGDIRAIIFWLKTHAGWRETDRGEFPQIADVAPREAVIYPPFILPCNGRALCLKIRDPRERHAYYERVLERKLPAFDPALCPTSLSNGERHALWNHLIAVLERSPVWQKIGKRVP